MKLDYCKTLFLILAAFSLAMTANSAPAEVYKIVDADGNVTYTDKPPGDGSSPIELKPLSVIEAPSYEQPQAPTRETSEAGQEEGGKEMSLKYLRKNYRDFSIVAPQQEESLWNPQSAIPVAWNTRYALQPGMQVIVSIDGEAREPTSEQVIPIDGLHRGEHTVSAELRDAKNRKIATAETVTFFVRQPGLYQRGPRPTPHGGG
jgi:hypothetical protein